MGQGSPRWGWILGVLHRPDPGGRGVKGPSFPPSKAPHPPALCWVGGTDPKEFGVPSRPGVWRGGGDGARRTWGGGWSACVCPPTLALTTTTVTRPIWLPPPSLCLASGRGEPGRSQGGPQVGQRPLEGGSPGMRGGASGGLSPPPSPPTSFVLAVPPSWACILFWRGGWGGRVVSLLGRGGGVSLCPLSQFEGVLAPLVWGWGTHTTGRSGPPSLVRWRTASGEGWAWPCWRHRLPAWGPPQNGVHAARLSLMMRGVHSRSACPSPSKFRWLWLCLPPLPPLPPAEPSGLPCLSLPV